MIARMLGAFAAAAGLALAPLSVDARVLTVPGCGAAVRMLIVPGDPATPGPGDRGCAKACHAVTERRGKSPGLIRCCG